MGCIAYRAWSTSGGKRRSVPHLRIAHGINTHIPACPPLVLYAPCAIHPIRITHYGATCHTRIYARARAWYGMGRGPIIGMGGGQAEHGRREVGHCGGRRWRGARRCEGRKCLGGALGWPGLCMVGYPIKYGLSFSLVIFVYLYMIFFHNSSLFL